MFYNSVFSILRACGKCAADKPKNSVKAFLLNAFTNIDGFQARQTSFFTKTTADQLWKGVTSVSNAGRKRGRGKGSGRKIAKDLNRGQIIGIGKANMLWPGLTVPVLRGRELVERQKLPEDPQREERLLKMRNEMGVFRRIKISPIERGWSGNKMPGRRIGPPDPVGEDKFEGFDTVVLEMKSVFNMTGNMGRKRKMSVFVVTGNGQGMAGFGLGKALDGNAALKTAKNRAGQKLMHIERYNDHTVFHDFFTQMGKTKIFVSKKPEGYGLKCHRAIKSICEIIGIKDLYAKVEGSVIVQQITRAFFLGLLRQKTHQQISEEQKLHLVEISKERDDYPQLVASPTECLEAVKEYPDMQEVAWEGRVVLKRKTYPPFFEKLPSWDNHLRKTLRFRNMDQVKLQLKARYGAVQSFYTEKYSECNPEYKKKESE